MNRLTKKFMDKVLLPNIPMEIKNKKDLEEYHEVRRDIENKIIRLAAYEDTGLEPEEVEKLDKQIDELYEKLNHYQTAGKSKDRITRTWQGQYKEKWEDFSMRCVQKLTAIEDLEEQGLLIKLPCKVGDSVYFIMKEFDVAKESWKRNIDEYIVTEIRGNKYNPLWFMASSEKCTHIDFHPTQIGKTVFLTREEAEKALEVEQ